jgi:hypothetical protein
MENAVTRFRALVAVAGISILTVLAWLVPRAALKAAARALNAGVR